MLLRLLATFGIAIAIGCGKSREAPAPAPVSTAPMPIGSVVPITETERKAAEDLVLSYFGALASKDCAALLGIVQSLTAADCKEDVHDWASHGAALLGLGSIKHDGRDPTAILVSARIRYDQKESEQIVRVVPGPKGPQVFK